MTRSRCPGIPGTVMAALVLALCSMLAAVPAAAVTQHLGTGPEFSATVSGTNEFSPGEDTTITILVKNTGLNSMKQVMMGTIQPEDQQNTAKAVTIGLGSAGDAVLVRTDPAMKGDLVGGQTVPVTFRVKISANATAGEYQLPLTLSYRYLRVIVQERADVFENAYNNGETTIPITVRIQPYVKAEVIGAVPEGIVAGSEGYLNLTIRNTGPENGTKASVKLLRNSGSPVIPTDSTVFIGDFPSGGTVTCRYKVSVSKDATEQTYPVDVTVSYTNREGSVVTSALTTVGVVVDAQPVVTVESAVPEIPRGSEKAVGITYRNNGVISLTAAQVRIEPHGPVSARDGNAYLGDIPPGGMATAVFVVAADDSAEEGDLTFDSTLRYRDSTGTSIESDPVPVTVKVVPAANNTLPVAVAIVAAVVLCAAFIVYRQKSKSR